MTQVVLEVEHATNGFRFFWAKQVQGFDPSTHCMNCLIGPRIEVVKHGLAAGGKVHFNAPEGALIYICGVSEPYRWAKNFHMTLRVCSGEETVAKLYTGQRVKALNTKPAPFTAKVTQEKFGHLPKAYTTCRNFQFAAHYFPDAQPGTGHARRARRPAAGKEKVQTVQLSETARHPKVVVSLLGSDANSKAVLQKALAALRHAGVDEDEIQLFRKEVGKAGIGRLYQTIQKWMTIT